MQFKTHVLEPLAATVGTPVLPEFIRLPKAGIQCQYTGIPRSTMNGLILAGPHNNFNPPVKSVVLRRPGNTRGVRLIVYASLMAYLHSLAETQNINASEQ